MKRAGLKWQFYFKKHYMFYVLHSRFNKDKRSLRDFTWKYWTNDVNRVMHWFNTTDKPWHQEFKQGTSASALYILTP